MESKTSSNDLKIDEKIHNTKNVCSVCGRVLLSSHEGIVGDNNITFCEYCYKNLMFPNFHDHYMEMVD